MARAKKSEATETVQEEKKTTTRTRKKPAEADIKQIIEPETVDQRDIEIDILKAQIEQQNIQIEQLKELIAQNNAQPQRIVVATNDSERVWFLWMADVSNENQILIGENGQYGRIVGQTGTFYVPKQDLSRVMDSSFRYYLEHRWLIVLSGLTDEEKEALGVNYRDGELLDEKAFRSIAEMGPELLEIFPALCDEHKEMVASKYHDAYMAGKEIERSMVVKLNKIYPNVAFKDILDDMNYKEANSEEE